MSQSLKWMKDLCFGLSAVWTLSSVAASKKSSIPADLLLQNIQRVERQAELDRVARGESHIPGSPEGFVEWDPELLPESSRSFLYYDLTDASFESLEKNVDEHGAPLL